MSNQIKLIISDLDGTLLGADHQLSPLTLDTLKAIYQRGIPFWIATGRHHQDAKLIRDQIGFPIRMITANGATVSDDAGNLQVSYALALEVAKEILSLKTPEGVYTNAYQDELWLTAVPDKVFEDYYHPGGFSYTICEFSDRWHLPFNKIFFTSLQGELLVPIAKTIEHRYGDHVDVTFSMPQCLEIMPKGVNKGSAILAAIATMGIQPHEVMAFGDGLNDLEMLSLVGSGHLLENANPKLKAALPHLPTIGHHGDSAVAKALSRYFLV